MEGQLTQFLRNVSHSRSRIVEKVNAIGFIDHIWFFHVVLIAATVASLIAVYAQIRSLTLFSMHPLFMTIGTLIFIAEGIAAYRNRVLVEAFAPIMASSLRAKNRSIHQVLQIAGGTFLGFGMMFIVANKFEFGKTILPHTLHSITGTAALILVTTQIIVGHQKIEALEAHNTKTRRWHGDLGLLTWDLLCLSIVFGLMSFIRLKHLNLLVYGLILLAWVAVHSQMRRKGADLEWLIANEREAVDTGGADSV